MNEAYQQLTKKSAFMSLMEKATKKSDKKKEPSAAMKKATQVVNVVKPHADHYWNSYLQYSWHLVIIFLALAHYAVRKIKS